MISSSSSSSESSSCAVSAGADGPLEHCSSQSTTTSATTPTTNSSSSRNRRMRRPHQQYSNVNPPLLLIGLLQVLLLFCVTQTHAYKDANVYPWGTNPNTHFKMYWKDAANVIQDLSQFQALYITVHGCVWSECGVDNFDDDGENHDGDEEWYQSRTRTFCANAAYSLYGIRKNNFKLVNTCSKGTYINSFFTYGGADTLARALDLTISTKDNNRYTNTNNNNNNDDSYSFTSNSDCVATNQNGNRFLEEDEEEEVDDAVASGSSTSWSSTVVSATMGCAANPTSKYSTFALAGFSDNYCSGQHFVETLDPYKSYNRAMHKVSCHRIWDLASYNRNKNTDDGYYINDDAAAADGDNRRALLNSHQGSSNSDPPQDEVKLVDYTHEEDHEHNDHRQLSNDNNVNYNKRNYNSVAEQLLYHSWACDLTLYPTLCPDPYGLKRKYTNVFKAAANGQPVSLAIMNARLRKPIRILTYLSAFTGVYLLLFAYYLKNRAYIQNHGGGVAGVWATIQRDIFAAHVILTEKVKRARERHLHNKRNRKAAAAVAEANANGGGGSGGHRRGSSSGGGGGGMWNTLFGKVKNKKKKKKRRSSKHHHASVKRTPSGRSIREGYTGDEDDVSDGDGYAEMTDEYQSQRSRQSSRYTSANYSSSRTSKAAEAAFAAAAQFDLEQQGGGGGSNTSSSRQLGHPAILPTHPNSGRSRSRTRNSSSRRSSTRSSSNNGGGGGGGGGGSSRSLSHSSSRRSQSNPSGSHRRLDPSPTRSPGGTSVRRPSSHTRRSSSTRRSKSPDGRVFV